MRHVELVCAVAPHSQFGEEARRHLYINEWKSTSPGRRRLSLTQYVLGKPIPRGLELALGIKTWSKDVRLEYSALHLQFFHWAARMLSLDWSFNSLRAEGTNGRPDFSVSWGTSGDPATWPNKIWSGSRVPRLAKESAAPKRWSSAGWMPKRIGSWSVGVWRRHPVTMRKASFKTLSMRRVCALQYQTGSRYSAVE